MCACIEFVIQVAKQKNARVFSLLLGWYYAIVFYYAPPDLLRREPLEEGKNACKTQENCVSAGGVAIVNLQNCVVFFKQHFCSRF